MLCPKCDTSTRVLESRPTPEDKYVIRRRRACTCGNLFSTLECIAENVYGRLRLATEQQEVEQAPDYRPGKFDARGFFGDVRKTMNARGMTGKRLAEVTGVNEATLSRVWSGEHLCSAESLVALAVWAGLSPASYYDRSPYDAEPYGAFIPPGLRGDQPRST